MHDSLLSNLCIGQLADLVGGQLRLGCMPPLGGHLEPVGRICPDSCGIRPGDVFWGLDTDGTDRSREAEVAFLRDASGAVICGRRLEPWAGKFSIEVEDTRTALWQLAQFVRSEFDGPVIGLAGDENGEFGPWIKAVLGDAVWGDGALGEGTLGDGGELTERGWLPDVSIRSHVSIQLPLELLSLTEVHRAAVLRVPTATSEEMKLFSALCDPRIVVINTTHHSETRPLGHRPDSFETCDRLREAMSGQTHLLLMERTNRTPSGECRVRMTCVSPAGDLPTVTTASHVRSGESLDFEWHGESLSVPRADESDLPMLLAACEVGRLLGRDRRQIADALIRQSRARHKARQAASQPHDNQPHGKRNPTAIAEASPFAPDLRESGATLPPGLERFAC